MEERERTIVLLRFFEAPFFVVKRELKFIPIFGLFVIKTDMIAINRSAGHRSLLAVMRRAAEEVRHGRQFAGERFDAAEALRLGLHGSSLLRFYHLGRACLVKSETYFDAYDRVFARVHAAVPRAPARAGCRSSCACRSAGRRETL